MITTKGKLTRVLTLVLVLATVFSCAAYSVLGAESLMSGSAGKGYASASPASESPVAIELLPGAEVRLDEEQSGLRFTTRIPTADLAAIAGEYTVGTLIYPTDKLEGALTVETEGALNLTDAKPIVDGEYTYFYAAIVDILPANYARAFSAVSYIKIGDDYFYTAYSEADNSRSIFEVAVAAWEGSYKDNAIVKAYLDKVVVINGSMQLSKTIKGYTSPYAVSYANNTITVTATDGTLVDGDIATMIVDYNGRVFTGGWTIADNKLTAPYQANLNVIETFDGLNRDESSNDLSAGKVWFDLGDTATTTVGISNGVLTYKKSSKDAKYPKFHFKGNLSEALGDTNDTLTISMSIKLPSGYGGFPKASFKLYDYNNSSGSYKEYSSTFMKMAGSSALQDSSGTNLVYSTSNKWMDITFKIDLLDAKVYFYCNGELVSNWSVSVPEGKTTLLEWVKGRTSTYVFAATFSKMDYASKQGFEIDTISWGVSKTH